MLRFSIVPFGSALSLLALDLLASASLRPAPAVACSNASPRGLVLSTARLTSDGVLAGTIYGCPGCTGANVQVLDPFGAVVAGTFIELPETLRGQGWFAFRPSAAWLEGATYQVRFLPDEASLSVGGRPVAVLTAAEAALFDAEVQVITELRHVEWGIDPVPCVEPALLAPLSCGQPSPPILGSRSSPTRACARTSHGRSTASPTRFASSFSARRSSAVAWSARSRGSASVWSPRG